MFKVAKMVQAGGGELQDRAEWFWHGSNLILIVADGAGGISGGAEAAQFAVNHAREKLSSVALNREGLAKLLTLIDRQMASTRKYGETTCVVVALTEMKVFGASVGDSGAWIISQSGAQNLTANQCRKPFMGSGCATPVGFERATWDGTLLLASDGLLKYTSSEKITHASLGSDLDRAAQDLVELVRYPSGALPDDVSIVLARRV
jgi:PPM family protein phosphatase